MNRTWIIVGVCFWTLAAVAVGIRVMSGDDSRPTPFPRTEFTLLRSDGSLDTLRASSGRPALFLVYLPTCGACLDERSKWRVLAEAAAERGIAVWALTAWSGGPDAFTIPHAEFRAFPSAEEAVAALGVTRVPSTILLNSAGEVLDGHVGAMSERDLARLSRRIARGGN